MADFVPSKLPHSLPTETPAKTRAWGLFSGGPPLSAALPSFAVGQAGRRGGDRLKVSLETQLHVCVVHLSFQQWFMGPRHDQQDLGLGQTESIMCWCLYQNFPSQRWRLWLQWSSSAAEVSTLCPFQALVSRNKNTAFTVIRVPCGSACRRCQFPSPVGLPPVLVVWLLTWPRSRLLGRCEAETGQGLCGCTGAPLQEHPNQWCALALVDLCGDTYVYVGAGSRTVPSEKKDPDP